MSDLSSAVVKVFRGKPLDRSSRSVAEFRGTAFLITDRWLLTCKHVVDEIPAEEIFLLGDGAWDGGGVRRIKDFRLHDGRDVAALELAKETGRSSNLPLAQDSPISSGTKLTLLGYTRGDGSLESPEANVSGYDGAYDLERTDKPIGQGMSGGPAVLDGRVVGMVQARSESSALLIPLSVLRVFTETELGSKVRGVGRNSDAAGVAASNDSPPLPIEGSVSLSARDFATGYLKANTDALMFFVKILNKTREEPLSAAAVVREILPQKDPLRALFKHLERAAELITKPLTDAQYDAIWQMCDYATCLELPQNQIELINQQLAERRIDAKTNDRQLIVVHLAQAFEIPQFRSSSVAAHAERIFERRTNRLVTTDEEAIRMMGISGPETGAGRRAAPSADGTSSNPASGNYQEQFIRGLAYQLHLPRAGTEGLDLLRDQINLRFADWKADAAEDGKSSPPVVAVMLTEPRSNDVEGLKASFEDLYFIQLPGESDRDYAAIMMRRDDIRDLTNRLRQKSDG